VEAAIRNEQAAIVDGLTNIRNDMKTGTLEIVQGLTNTINGLSEIYNKMPTLGQKPMSGSWPVVISNDQGPISVTTAPLPNSIPINLLWDKVHSAVNVNEWQDLITYTVPAGYNLDITSFSCSSATANEAARASDRRAVGTYNCVTNTFTDGLSYILPEFGSRLYLLVTTAIGAALNDTITVTYTNNLGVAGRTATVTIPKSSLVGTRIEIVLQGDDFGFVDITNVTHSATGQAGAFTLASYIELFYEIITSSSTLYKSSSVSLGGSVLHAGDTVYLQYLANTKTTYNRRVSLSGVLTPIT
jgi:hypothetical protein